MLPEKEYFSMPISILKTETIVNNLKKKNEPEWFCW